MKNATDVAKKLSKLELQSEIVLSDKTSRCNLRFNNPNGAGVIEIEFDYDLPEEELIKVNLNLPVAEDKKEASLNILKEKEETNPPVEEVNI